MSGSGTENKQCADLLSLSVTSLTYTKAIISSLMGWAARDADKSVLPFRNPFLSHFNTIFTFSIFTFSAQFFRKHTS